MLIKAYISVIPSIGDEPWAAMQSITGWLPKQPVHTAMAAKTGVAARANSPAHSTIRTSAAV